MGRLKDKVAVITGGAGGIGLATAKLFLEEGAKVVIVDISKEVLEKASYGLDHKNLSYCVADVSKVKDTEKFVENCLEVHGKIDIFFANAGIEGTSKPITDYPDEIFEKVIGVNLKGVWLGCKYVIPKMKNGGSVIITSSVAGLKGFAGLGAYVASKHAVVGLMRVAAQENAKRKIRVNTIHPGPVNNNMMRRIEVDMSPSSPDEVMKGFESAVPLGRYAESKEIAEMALFLASDESKFITGTTHVVDGGMLCS
ncbi:SDR family NAD(P)-dependent oxidoreductase [Arenibacter sp. N53]|uniref:SDR family NAD(P)-dependent oxidoreductase n=1 Tax=Arenibacter TaxID=178469 RepID=UPI000CD46C4F|nr:MULTISPECIES: SDR family NAD(P)-dependent oxidoreductase [Arenibacter]MCM4153422.1 SDR family NAD(P)-dependent oxidoreductase [Arenibacter sp. N53]